MHADNVGVDARQQAECLGRLMYTHSAAVNTRAPLAAAALMNSVSTVIDNVGSPMRRFKRKYRNRITGKATHADLCRVHHPRAPAISRSRSVVLDSDLRRNASQDRHKAIRAIASRSWMTMTRRPGPSGQRRRPGRRRPRRPAPPSTSSRCRIRCIPQSFSATLVGRNCSRSCGHPADRDSIDRAGLGGFLVHFVEQRDNSCLNG